MSKEDLIPPSPTYEGQTPPPDDPAFFAKDDPIALFADWFKEARAKEPNDANAMTLATVDEELELKDASMTMTLYHIAGSPHADTLLMAYLPASRTLVEADVFSPGAAVNPYAANLRENTDTYKLKVDRSFVASLDKSANGGVIIQAVVTLGRALGMGVVIEGVETEEQKVLLRLAGCNEMQGYLFAKPGPAKEIDQLLGTKAAPEISAERVLLSATG